MLNPKNRNAYGLRYHKGHKTESHLLKLDIKQLRNQSIIPILLTYEINYRKFCTFGFFL